MKNREKLAGCACPPACTGHAQQRWQGGCFALAVQTTVRRTGASFSRLCSFLCSQRLQFVTPPAEIDRRGLDIYLKKDEVLSSSKGPTSEYLLGLKVDFLL